MAQTVSIERLQPGRLGSRFKLAWSQVSGPAEISVFSDCCTKWLVGGDARLRRAAVQAFGFIAELEAPQFGRRIRPHIPKLTEILSSHTVKASAPAHSSSQI